MKFGFSLIIFLICVTSFEVNNHASQLQNQVVSGEFGTYEKKDKRTASQVHKRAGEETSGNLSGTKFTNDLARVSYLRAAVSCNVL